MHEISSGDRRRVRAVFAGVILAATAVLLGLTTWMVVRGEDPPTVDVVADGEADSQGSTTEDPPIDESDDDGSGEGLYDLVDLRSGVNGVDLRIYQMSEAFLGCGDDTRIRVGVSTELAVGVVEIFSPSGADSLFMVSEVVGGPEGDLVHVIVARVPLSVDRVEATFPDGSVDVAVPIDGITALANRYGSAQPGGVDLALHGAFDSVETHSMVVPNATIANREILTSCPASPADRYPTVAPPTFTPAPTTTTLPSFPLEGDRPEDRAAIVAAYDLWFNGDISDEEKAAVLDDPTGVVEAQTVVDEAYGPTIDTAAAFVDSIEFIGEDEATVGFHIDVGGSRSFTEQGRAVRVDGTWRITRDTVCPLIALGGGYC